MSVLQLLANDSTNLLRGGCGEYVYSDAVSPPAEKALFEAG